MKVEKTATGLIIRQPTDSIKRKCLQYFSLVNPVREYFIYSGNDPNNKPIFGKDKDVIYITSGFLKIKDDEISKLKPTIIQPTTPKRVDIKMNRQPRSALQRDCIDKMITQNNGSNKLTIELKPGTGKMEPYSRKIPTPTINGYTLMGDLKVGDHVFDRTGNQTRILNIFEQGEKDVYKITFQDGRTALCGAEHLWTVKRNGGEWETLTTKDIKDSNSEFGIPLCEPVNYPEKPDQLSCFGQYHSITSSVYNTYVNSSPTKMREFLDNEGFKGESGCVDTTTYSIDKSFWINDIILPILYAMGYSAYYDETDNGIHYSKPDCLMIRNIEFSHTEKCRCIMVDNPEHLYLTEDFIVTHNTFIALYAISKLGLKPLIVAPTTLLKNQWVENLTDLGIDKSDIATNIYDAPSKTFCVVTISAIENELRKDWAGLMDVINKSSFGIKVTDESHLHLKGLLKLDSICNIKHNWYLSATLGRSDFLEDNILNRALLDSDRFIGNASYEEYQHEYVNIYLQDIYYNPSTKLCQNTFKYGSKGLIRSTYYNMLMSYKNGEPFLKNVITLMKRAKGLATYDGKILLLVPLVSIIQRIIEEMKKDPYFSKYTYSGVDGSMPLPARRQAMECDFILSTSMSMGTGVDVSNLAVVVNFDQYSSPIITEQIVGRLRDRGKETWYIDICDHVKQARSFESWGRKRRTLVVYFPGVKPNLKIFPKIKC